MTFEYSEVAIRDLLDEISGILKKELKNNRFKFVTEYDLQARIYSLLSRHPDFQDTFEDSEGNPIFKIHAEYPRLFSNEKTNELASKRMRYDIVILKDSEKEVYRNNEFKKKAVAVAFEIKLLGNSKKETVINTFAGEFPAFTSSSSWSSLGQELPELSVIFVVNFGKRRDELNLEKREKNIKKGIEEWCKKKDEELQSENEKRCKLFYFYLESYYENKPPQGFVISL